MAQEDIKRKIERLLALSESDNPNEALSAIQMARKLMLKYNLTTLQVSRNRKSEVTVRSLAFKKLRMNAYHRLSAYILAKNFRCKTYWSEQEIHFMGFREDADAALSLMAYVTRFMERGFRAYVAADQRNRPFAYRDGGAAFLKNIEDSWKKGFQLGLLRAFEEQNREQEAYQLMLAVPQPVTEAFEKLRLVKGSAKVVQESLDTDAFDQGEDSGRRAVDSRSLEVDLRRLKDGP